MRRWFRKFGDLKKTATLSEGEIISLLISSKKLTDKEMLNDAYDSTKILSESRTKAFSLLVTMTIIAIFAKFEVISGLSTIGVSIAEAAFKPIALAGYSAAGLYFAYFHSRYRFFELWFHSIFEKSDAGGRAELLLRYPLAFDLFKHEAVVRGLPKFVFAEKNELWKLPAVILLVLALLVFTLLAFALWVSLSIEVWSEGFPNRIVAGSVIFGSLLTSVLSATLPFTTDKKSKYEHYGLSQMLSNLQQIDPARHQYYLNKVAQITRENKQMS
jgi:hypothetical protein